MRNIVTLACTDCKRRNYNTTKNKRTTTDRLEFKKYCQLVPPTHGASGDQVAAVARTGFRMRPRVGTTVRKLTCRPVAQLVEHRSPKPGAGGSSPSWPASFPLRKRG